MKWVEAMKTYRREFDEDLMTFQDKPVHDWASHWADMTRYKAVAFQHRDPSPRGEVVQERAITDFDLFAQQAEEQVNEILKPWRRDHVDWSVLDPYAR